MRNENMKEIDGWASGRLPTLEHQCMAVVGHALQPLLLDGKWVGVDQHPI
jgi:hypothetical protein